MKTVIWMVLLLPLPGCFQQVTKPSEITLVEAMKQVGQGLAAMREEQGDIRTGLIAESAEVTFKITADSKSGGELKVDLAAPVVSDGIGVTGSLSGERSGGRSNTVTIKFKNLLTLPKDTIGYMAATAQVNEKVKSGGDKPPIVVLPDDVNNWPYSYKTRE
jgi:hypothetical protein